MVVAGGALVVLAAYDLSAPLRDRLPVRQAAEQAAAAGADAYFAEPSPLTARVAAESAARRRGATLSAFTVETGGAVTVKVTRRAYSVLLHRVGFERFTEVHETATAGPRAGPPPTSSTTAAN